MPDRLTRPDSVILGTAAVLLVASLACGLIVPPLFGSLLLASVGIAAVFLAFCFPTAFCVAWLLVTSLTLEMALRDLLGEDAFQPAIAVVKGIEIGLGFLCMARFGPRADPLCPAWRFWR
jgi:TRAP-type C4-dicarboxylate transport system permease large subunit